MAEHIFSWPFRSCLGIRFVGQFSLECNFFKIVCHLKDVEEDVEEGVYVLLKDRVEVQRVQLVKDQ